MGAHGRVPRQVLKDAFGVVIGEFESSLATVELRFCVKDPSPPRLAAPMKRCSTSPRLSPKDLDAQFDGGSPFTAGCRDECLRMLLELLLVNLDPRWKRTSFARKVLHDFPVKDRRRNGEENGVDHGKTDVPQGAWFSGAVLEWIMRRRWQRGHPD
ncbi:F-BOX WITH WD-40 2 [Striga asiatica]|uniref:F-BOX WITH WD-40 2 n=1 Tax=Striga asiatica TaxID=4170 RepID=A0A5A7P778_STRAF|nr:F-BOX WITH WD-40 2 [Striga asiatica]